MSISVIIVLGAIGFLLYHLRLKAKVRDLKQEVDAEVDRLRQSGETPRTISETEFLSIRHRFASGTLDRQDIEALAAWQWQNDPHYQALQNPEAVFTAKALERQINESLRQQGAAPLPTNSPLNAAARRHAEKLGKQLIAKLEEEAFLHEFEKASQAVPTWVDANPNNPIAQRILADMLELSQDSALQGDTRDKALADVLMKAHRHLLELQLVVQQPLRRNPLLGGEEPVF
jgi:hypothetical protein